MDSALGRLPDLAEWQDEAWLARERFPAFATALRQLHRPTEPHDIFPEHPAWTRLAYDELLAGQLALALVRAHMRRQSGRGSASEGRLRARILKLCPMRSRIRSKRRLTTSLPISRGRKECCVYCREMLAPARPLWH
jgi:ATP-dependent DNA helicase RecG